MSINKPGHDHGILQPKNSLSRKPIQDKVCRANFPDNSIIDNECAINNRIDLVLTS